MSKRHAQMLAEVEFINQSRKIRSCRFHILKPLKKGRRRDEIIKDMPNSRLNRTNFLARKDDLAEKIYLLQ